MSKLGVNVSYRYSAKVNPNEKDSPWAGAEVSYSIEQESVDRVDFNKLAEELFQDAKVQVFAQLGVEFTTDENGALQPVVEVSDIPKKTAPKPPWKKDGAAPRARPNYDHLPRIMVDGIEYIDFRDAKLDGTVKPRFPDFKTTDLREGYYLTLPDGETKSDFYVKLLEEGIDV